MIQGEADRGGVGGGGRDERWGEERTHWLNTNGFRDQMKPFRSILYFFAHARCCCARARVHNEPNLHRIVSAW